MALVERIEYVMTKEILDDAALTAVPPFVPPPPPKYPPQFELKLLAGAGGCLLLMVIGADLDMGKEHYIITGIGIAVCLFAAAMPWIARSINRGLERFTNYARAKVRDRLYKATESAIGTPVRWEFDEEGFRTHMLETTRRFAWTDLKRIRTRDKFWLLNVKVNELFIPIAALTDTARDHIRRKAAEAKVKIVEDKRKPVALQREAS